MENNKRIEEIKARIEEMKNKREQKVNAVVTPNISAINEVITRKMPVSESQIKTYFNLCQQKGEHINPIYRSWDGKQGGEMDKEIKRLLQLPTVKRPSEGQVNIVKEICERNGWQIPEYKNLTGGREGTMSKLINELMQLERESQRLAPPTEGQLESILEMYFCPDVDMSDLHESFGIQYKRDENGKTWWTRMSQEDIAKAIPELITHQDASDFIYKYQTVYYSWKKNRLSDTQIRRIRTLQEKCGMKPMEDYQLMQFDRETANTYIFNIELVWRDADLVKFPKEKVYVDDKNGSDFRSNKDTLEKLHEGAVKAKESVIHGLYAMMGMSGRDEVDNWDEDLIRDLASVVTEICGVQPVYELLLECYSEDEVCDILNIKIEQMVAPELDDECTRAEKEIIDMMDLFTISTIDEEKKYVSATGKELVEKYYNEALISDELYDTATQIFNM